MQQISIGRQQGQGFLITCPEGVEFYVDVEKCRNGYVKLTIECQDDFEILRWDGEQRERMKSVKGEPPIAVQGRW